MLTIQEFKGGKGGNKNITVQIYSIPNIDKAFHLSFLGPVSGVFSHPPPTHPQLLHGHCRKWVQPGGGLDHRYCSFWVPSRNNSQLKKNLSAAASSANTQM